LIDECFIHLEGIGEKTSEKLKELGFMNWQQCMDNTGSLPFNGNKREKFIRNILDSQKAVEESDIAYLVANYPTREHWRVLAEFFHEATWFDIETTGISWYDNHATVISAYMDGKLLDFKYGENLDDFLELVDRSRLLVSFNGSGYDIPFLEQTYHIPSLDCPHVDLRWISYHMGYRGGLKIIEKSVGIERPGEVSGIDGLEAIDLFYRWQGGDSDAGRKLMVYCRADVISSYILGYRLLTERGLDLPGINEQDLFNGALGTENRTEKDHSY
jgi:uncharacterized protein YprB with RNaseH-like and TPR domain